MSSPVILFLGVLMLAAVTATAAEPGDVDRAIEELRQSKLPDLFAPRDAFSDAERTYFEHYGLDLDDHDFGAFDSGPYRLAAHVFRPPEARGTVIVLHGYLDHAGILRPLVHELLAAGWDVALFDLPGHGLSTGERASIGDFAEYAAALDAFLALCREHLPGPFHLVGHSTGGAVILDRVLTRGHDEGRVVLLAPLVRSYAWHLSGFGAPTVREKVFALTLMHLGSSTLEDGDRPHGRAGTAADPER